MKTISATIILLCLVMSSLASAEYHIAKPANEPIATGLARSATLPKAGFRLARLFADYKKHVAAQSNRAFTPSDHGLVFSKGRVLVDARATNDGPSLLNNLRKLGLGDGRQFGKAVSGMLPVGLIKQAAALDSLRSIHAAIPPIRNTGDVTSQGDIAMRADIARSYGYDGSGITVGVLSDSFDSLGGASADIISGDLPAEGVTVINGESSYCGVLIYCIDEGRAMLQIVHDVAPGASLLFHTALATVADFANAISALEAAGADVIVDDVLYLNEPMFEDGIVAQAVDSVFENGVAYYSAAGNQGRKGYDSAFVDSGELLCLEMFEPEGDCHPLYERVGRMHDFDPGPDVDNYLNITIPYNTTLSIALQWDESFGNAKIDHDVVLFDETGETWYEFGANDNVNTGEGWEVLQYTNYDFMAGTESFSLTLTYDDIDSINPPAGALKMVIFGGATIDEYSTNSSTLIGHPNSAGAAAVGAAFFLETPEFGVSPPLLEPYSSAGGTPILFAANGTRLPAPEVRMKPEFTAVDGVNTTFFYADLHGDDGIDDFFGTSAAAPHAAGVAALMLEADPAATPGEINAVIESTTIDMLSAGFDYDSGYGLIQADAAIIALIGSADTTPPSITAPADISVEATSMATPVSLGLPTVTDDTDPNPTVTNDAPETFPVGETTVTWTATDTSGNSATDTQRVTVTDTTAPTITAPNDISVESSTEVAVDLGTPAVSDLADPNPAVSNDAPQLFPVGSTLVTWTATDASGNSATDTQTVAVTEPAPLPPAAPTNLTATIVKTGRGKNKLVTIRLDWVDNSDNETHFVVEGCQAVTTGKGRNKTTECNFTEINNQISADTTNLEIDPSTEHDHFRVKAVNAVGSSDWSNEAEI